MVAAAVLWAPVLAGLSLAIEYGRALKVRSELQVAADMAVSKAAAMAGGGAQAVAGTLRQTLDQNLRRSLRGFPFAHAMTDTALVVRIDARVANLLAGIVGNRVFHFAVTSEAILPKAAGIATVGPELQPVPPADLDDDDAETLLERGHGDAVRVTSGL